MPRGLSTGSSLRRPAVGAGAAPKEAALGQADPGSTGGGHQCSVKLSPYLLPVHHEDVTGSEVHTWRVVSMKGRDAPLPPCPAPPWATCAGESPGVGEVQAGVCSLTPCGHGLGGALTCQDPSSFTPGTEALQALQWLCPGSEEVTAHFPASKCPRVTVGMGW